MRKPNNGENINALPEFYSAITLCFSADIDLNSILDDFSQIKIQEIKIYRPKYEPSVCIDIAVVQNEHSWELDDVLTKMFSKIDEHLCEIKAMINKYHAEVYVDIAFYQHSIFPVLIISETNVKKIAELHANISIDST